MTDYICNEFLALHFRDERTAEERLRRVSEQIEQNTPYRVCDVWLSPRRKLGIVNLCATPPETRLPLPERLKSDWLKALPATNRLRVRDRMVVLQTGYTTTPERWFERSIGDAGDGLTCDDAGGIAAFCVARLSGDGDERLFLWSTRPGLRVIASAETPELVVAGTRPRLVHAVTREFGAPHLDHGYLRASFTGWSIDDHTPYEGTALLSVDRLLRVSEGRRIQLAHPTPAYQRDARPFWRQRPIYRNAVREAVEPLRALRGFELRLSGGKDSRLIAAALFERGITPSTVMCQGADDSAEVNVAREVARRLGWPLKTGRPVFAYLGNLVETVRYNLGLSDGFFATEPRHLGYQVHSLVGDVGPGLVMGHMELQKGGWAYSLKEPRKVILERCRQKVTRWRDAVIPELTQAMRQRVDAYVASLSLSDEAELPYWVNYQFRVGRWLTSHFLSHSREHLLVYPLVEEKVTRVCCNAPLWHLVSERLVAENTWKLAPALRDAPLVGDPYRFIRQRAERAQREEAKRAGRKPEAEAEPKSVVPAAAPKSTAPPAPRTAPRSNDSVDSAGDAFMRETRLHELCSYIRQGKAREELRSLTQNPVWAVIEEPSHARMKAAGMSAVRLNEYLYTAYQASVLYTEGPSRW